MKDKLAAMGGVSVAMIGEPMSPPADYTAAIVPSDGNIPETVLNAPRETHRVIIRFYVNAMAEPADAKEYTLDRLRAEIAEDICGDFDLGGTIAYALPTECSWRYGYQTVASTLYRLLDFTIAYRVDPTATFVQ